MILLATIAIAVLVAFFADRALTRRGERELQVLMDAVDAERRLSTMVEDPTPDDLTAVMDVVADPQPTLREELIPVPTAVLEDKDPTPPRYRDRTMVQVGLRLIHRGCRNARTDFATDWICPDCVAALKTTVAS